MDRIHTVDNNNNHEVKVYICITTIYIYNMWVHIYTGYIFLTDTYMYIHVCTYMYIYTCISYRYAIDTCKLANSTAICIILH